MKQDHRPWTDKTFSGGANTDADGAVVANNEGTYRDARNMRLVDDAGGNGTLVKIGGETVIHPPTVHGASTYRCIGAIDVKGRKVEFWASSQPASYAPLVRIDGVVTAQSDKIPYVYSHVLQLDKSEDCEGGLVFDANSDAIPLHWDIGHMLDELAAGAQTYFSGFDVTALQATPTRPVNRPVFLGLVDAGAGGGIFPGQYAYCLRYVNLTGDRTPDGPFLEHVDVPWMNGGAPSIPSAGVVGATPAQAGQHTQWGVRLLFRVDNKANFDSIEIIRRQLIQDAGPDAVEDIVVAARIAITPGQNEVLEHIDKGDTVDALPGDAEAVQTYYIKKAESVRYVNYRVAYGNVEIAGRDITASYGNDPLFPVTASIGTMGHADAVNRCYKRRFQSGERYGIGAMYYLPDGSQSFVDPVKDVQMPNRRDPKTGDSLTWSDAPCLAATTQCLSATKVGPTFEIFDHVNATGKRPTIENGVGRHVNVMMGGRRATMAPAGNDFAFSPVPGSGETYIDNSFKKTAWPVPLTPHMASEPWKLGLDYRVNKQVRSHYGTRLDYDPKVFNVTHHSLGMAFRGVAPVPGTQGFSMMATKPAGRVVAQGLARWVLKENYASSGDKQVSKELYSMQVSFPDFDAGVMNQSDFDAIAAGTAAGGYKVQMVSPLGFASEVYGSAMMAHANAPLGFLADMMSYARVLWDKGQINPGNADGINEPQADNSNYYAGFGRWRNGMGSVPWQTQDGNVELDVATAATTSIPGVLTLTFNHPVYSGSWAGPGIFTDGNTKNFHEPWYVVNIVRDRQPDLDDGYVGCNHFQAWVSDIGAITGQNQSFRLADERLADIEGYNTDGIERYVHVVDPALGDLVYMNVEGLTPSQVAQMLLQIPGGGAVTSPVSGTTVNGLYEVIDNGDGTRSVLMRSWVPVGARVEVRYDQRVPVLFFGDRVSAPCLAPIVDGYGAVNGDAYPNPVEPVPPFIGGSDRPIAIINADASGGYIPTVNPMMDPGDMQGCLVTHGAAVGPFNNYVFSDEYYTPFLNPHAFGVGNSGSNFNAEALVVNQFSNGVIHSLRQWLVMFDCEVKAPVMLSMYAPPDDRTFPQVNYYPRPYRFDGSGFSTTNGFFPSHTTLYPDPGTLGRGGFFHKTTIFSPHRVLPRVRNYRKPPFSKEETKLCNAVIWSEKHSPLHSDTPALKTYPVNNIEFIENGTGSIQYLYFKEGTMYVVTEHGTYAALIERGVVASPDGQDLTMYAQTNFIGTVQNLSRSVGMPTGTWETVAEGSVMTEGGARRDAMMWFDGTTVYRLLGNAPQDIAKGKYRKGLYAASSASRGNWGCGAYDAARDELYLCLSADTVFHASSPGTDHWYGTTFHRYDRMLFSGGRMYGMRDLTTYLLDDGDTLADGTPVEGWVKVASAPWPGHRMEWMRVKVDSPRKPTRIEFFNEDDTLVAWMDAATFGPFYLKKEDAWEHWIPLDRVTAAPSKRRIQGRVAYAKVIFADAGDDRVAMVSTQVKPLK